MEVRSLQNGFRYAVRSYGNCVGYCALSIRVGTRDEGEYHSGIAHFLEHTLFKGTSRRSSSAINRCLESLGGELNAYTTKEEIVLHATVLKKDLAKAAALLMEIATDAQFPQDEIEIEKGVVLDEIASYKDFPAEEVYDRFEEKLFASSPLARPILGTEESVKEITSDELRRFRSEFFTPDRMVMTMVSPLGEEEMCSIISKAAACLGSKEVPSAERTVTPPHGEHFNESIEKNNNEVNCVIGGLAPSLKDGWERIACLLLCNILGGPASSSILGSSLREKHGWVYNVECNYTPYSDTGVASVNFGCDRANLKKCIRETLRQINRFISAPMSPGALKSAKRQILGQNAIGMENGESQCLSMGKSVLSFGKIASQEEIGRLIEEITPEQLHSVACKVFNPDNLSTLIYL